MNDLPTTPRIKQQREAALAEDRRTILGLPPEQALKAIAEHPYPVTLVQSMAEEDLYLLVHTIGPDDALPVLALASNEQWDYVLDLETWDRDRLDPRAVTSWMARLLKADPDRLTYQIAMDKQDSFAYYLFHNIQVHIREYDQDPSEIGDDFFTEDQAYYIRLRPYPEEDQPHQDHRDRLVKDLLKRLAVYDYPSYRDLLLKSSSLIPAEAEEELYRLRNVRMAEKGFLPFEEAVGVYQPLTVTEMLARRSKPATPGGRNVDSYPIRVDGADAVENANVFTRTLAHLQDPAILERLQTEFAGLCNQIIAADGLKIRQKSSLDQVVRKTSDFISIGMEKTALHTGPDEPYTHAKMIQTHFLSDLFRVGYGCALELKWNAHKWRQGSWFERLGLPLSFWGEVWLGVLGGLLIKKPLYFDNYKTGVLYREFATLKDIRESETILQTIIAFDDVLNLMGIDPPRSQEILTSQNLLLTLWANHHLDMGGGKTVHPLTRDQLIRFLDALWQPDVRPRRISHRMRERFLDWLAARSGLQNYDISERMGQALEQWFTLIETELGSIEPEDLNPNYIYLFLFEPGA
jgi:hypothetical protein